MASFLGAIRTLRIQSLTASGRNPYGGYVLCTGLAPSAAARCVVALRPAARPAAPSSSVSVQRCQRSVSILLTTPAHDGTPDECSALADV